MSTELGLVRVQFRLPWKWMEWPDEEWSKRKAELVISESNWSGLWCSVDLWGKNADVQKIENDK
jgi:hypothetical protein